MTTPTRLSGQLRDWLKDYAANRYPDPGVVEAAADRLDTLERERDEALRMRCTHYGVAEFSFNKERAAREAAEAEVRRLTAALAQARTEE